MTEFQLFFQMCNLRGEIITICLILQLQRFILDALQLAVDLLSFIDQLVNLIVDSVLEGNNIFDGFQIVFTKECILFGYSFHINQIPP